MRGCRSVLVLATAVFVVGLGVAGCRRSSSSTAARLVVSGRADVIHPGEGRVEVTRSRNLRVGDQVRVGEGTAQVRLPDDRNLELRLGSELELQAAGSSTRTAPALTAGDALVTSRAKPVVLATTSGQVTVSGAARVSRGVALLVAVYQGSSVLAADGRSIAVPALRQVAVPAVGTFPTRLSPLEYSAADPWDQRYLSDAIELGNQLTARSQGFSAQLAPTEGRTAAYFRALFPRLAAEPAFDAPLVNPTRAPGETLVGASITLEGTRGSFTQRWAAVFGFHDEGAPWGLVALDQGVRRVPLLETIEGAIGRGPATFAQPPPGTGPSSLPPPAGSGSTVPTTPARPTTTTTTTVRGRPGGSTATTTTVPASGPPTTVPSGPLNTGSPLIDDTVNSLVDTLTGLLHSLGQ